MSRHDKHHHHASKSRLNRQKHGLALAGAGGAAMLVGFLTIAAGFGLWWVIVLGGLVALVVGLRLFTAR